MIVWIEEIFISFNKIIVCKMKFILVVIRIYSTFSFLFQITDVNSNFCIWTY